MRHTHRSLSVMLGTALVAVPFGAGLSVADLGNSPPSVGSARGMVYAGLVSGNDGPCADGFRAQGAGRPAVCTHGPDPAPKGVDVTVARSAADLSDGTSGSTTSTGSLPCVGDGASGPRVQAIYAVAADRPNRYADVAPLISVWATQMDDVVAKSARATGGERHIRFATSPDCAMSVANVTISTGGDDTFSNMINELRSQGFTRTDRKYLIWADATVYCGIGQLGGSDADSPSNAANSGPTFARVDSGCWGRSDHLSEVHELMHTLGAVQRSAPHSTIGFHCTDESDLMCYPDGAGVTMTQNCPLADEWLLDCNHDDYFNTSPAPGTYLDTHWNVADSIFLRASEPTSVDPEPSPSPTTESTTVSGSVSKKNPSKAMTLSVGSGPVSAALSYGSTAKGKSGGALTSMKLRILERDGTVIAQGEGPSVLRVAAELGAGTYVWEVLGTSPAVFTLSVEYVTP